MQLDSFCPRCFWYQIQMEFKMPFDRSMPGIMFHLDMFEKRLVEAHFAAAGKAPKWLALLGCTEPVEFPLKMTYEFPEHDITLVGMPDAVFRNKNDNLVLVDYKTAHYKGDDDPFMPAYETQMLGYAALLEATGIGKVDSAALVYFHNQVKEFQDKPLELLTEKGMEVPFEVKIHKVEIDTEDLEPLLSQIRVHANLPYPPEGLEKCKDCGRLEALLDKEVKMRNRQESYSEKDGLHRRVYYPQILKQRKRASQAGTGFDDEEMSFLWTDAPDCRPSAWDL
jgi:hypothetical protein